MVARWGTQRGYHWGLKMVSCLAVVRALTWADGTAERLVSSMVDELAGSKESLMVVEKAWTSAQHLACMSDGMKGHWLACESVMIPAAASVVRSVSTLVERTVAM